MTNMRKISRVKRSGIIDRILQIFLTLTVVTTAIVNLIYFSNMKKVDSKQGTVFSDELIRFQDSGHEKIDFDTQVKISEADVIDTSPLDVKKKVLLAAQSGKQHAYISIDDAIVYEKKEGNRGMHIIVLSQHTGRVMASRVFDTYLASYDKEISKFLSFVSQGRVVVFLTLDEASFSLGPHAREVIASYGSKHIKNIYVRDAWVFITVKGDKPLTEKFSLTTRRGGVIGDSWPPPATAHVYLQLLPKENECDFGFGEEAERRRNFCSSHDAYGKICNCSDPEPIYFSPRPLEDSNISDIPVVIMAAERPFYLHRMLNGFLRVPGVNHAMITVYIDCEQCEEPEAICKLYNLKFVRHITNCGRVCRISNHYRRTIKETFDTHPGAKAMIILEEDLDVSNDLMDYFSQTYPLLISDASLFCVSAWNDQGYSHVVQDPRQLYRINGMPGLGWILKRDIFEDELESKWPKPGDFLSNADWDVWLRLDDNLKGRDCIVPEISRTYHFGAKGVNMNEFFHERFFAKKPLNKVSGIKFNIERLQKLSYDKEIHELIRNSIVLDHSKNQCTHKSQFIPDTKGKTYVAYIKMEKSAEDEESLMKILEKPKQYETWMSMATCFNLWNLSPRGFYQGAIRFRYKENNVFIVGFPFSPFAIHKPIHIKPIFIAKKPKIKSSQ